MCECHRDEFLINVFACLNISPASTGMKRSSLGAAHACPFSTVNGNVCIGCCAETIVQCSVQYNQWKKQTLSQLSTSLRDYARAFCFICMEKCGSGERKCPDARLEKTGKEEEGVGRLLIVSRKFDVPRPSLNQSIAGLPGVVLNTPGWIWLAPYCVLACRGQVL